MSELWAALAGAIIGGTLSLVGSMVIADYQRRLTVRGDTQRAFSDFLSDVTLAIDAVGAFPERDGTDQLVPRVAAHFVRLRVLAVSQSRLQAAGVIVDRLREARMAQVAADCFESAARFSQEQPARIMHLASLQHTLSEQLLADFREPVPILPTGGSSHPLA